MGAKKRPFYRLVVADARSPRDGRFIEAIGTYDPLAQPAVVRVDAERVKEWMSKGAKPTDIARQLLVREGVLEHTGPRFEKVEKAPKPSKKQVAKARAAEEAAARPAPEPVAAAEVVAGSAEAAGEPAAAAVGESTAGETPAKTTVADPPATVADAPEAAPEASASSTDAVAEASGEADGDPTKAEASS
jgi:small subunit ribosomal protein S16